MAKTAERTDAGVKALALLSDLYQQGAIDDDVWTSRVLHRTHKRKVLDFARHPYLEELYTLPKRFRAGTIKSVATKKGTQAGISEWLAWLSITQAIRGMSVFYVLPTFQLVNRYVRERIDRTVDNTPAYSSTLRAEQQRQGQAGRQPSQSVTLKQFGAGVVAFVGSNASSAFTEFPADIGIIDEVDECDQDNLEMVPERLANSDHRWRIYAGNPTVPGFGIAEEYQNSSRHRWMIRCEAGHEIFPDFFQHLVEAEGEGVYRVRDEDWVQYGRHEARLICHVCGRPVDRRARGLWVAENQARADAGFLGYHFSKLFTGTTTTDELIERLDKGTRDTAAMTRFWNGDLGIEYMPEGARIDPTMLDACVEPYTMPARNDDAGLTLCGIDVGTRFHVWIARIVHTAYDQRARSMFIGDVRDVREILELLTRYKVRVGVMDAMPERRITQMICRRHRGMFACFYGSGHGTQKQDMVTKGKVITVDRTAALDQAKESVVSRFLMLPANARTLPEVYDQVGNSVRVFDEHANQGRGAWRWVEGNRPDHYLHALSYMMLARSLAARMGRRLSAQARGATVGPTKEL